MNTPPPCPWESDHPDSEDPPPVWIGPGGEFGRAPSAEGLQVFVAVMVVLGMLAAAILMMNAE